MWADRKLLLLLIGLAVVLAAVCAVVYLPGRSDAEPDPKELIALLDATEKAAAKAAPNTKGAAGHPNRGGNSAGAPSAWAPSAGQAQPLALRQLTRVARRPNAKHLPALRKAAVNPSPAIRETAMVGIGRLGDESDPHLLMNALQTDPSPAVRVAAATALGKLKCWEAGPLLIDALEDPDSRVRSRAGAAIDRIVGVKLGFDATDPKRNLVIQKIKTWWPEFYAGYLKRKAGG